MKVGDWRLDIHWRNEGWKLEIGPSFLKQRLEVSLRVYHEVGDCSLF